MKKSDLKTGMVVEVRGDLMLVLITPTSNLLMDSQGYLNLDDYSESLRSEDPDWDIVKVYSPNLRTNLEDLLNPTYRSSSLIWDGKSKEMTLEQVEEALGYRIRLVEE